MSAAVAPRKRLAKIKDETVFYEHQVTGVRWLAQKHSFLLTDEPGLGKSLQALTATAVDFEGGYASRFLVVAPATAKENWLDELDIHTHFTGMVLDGTPKQRRVQLQRYLDDGIDCLIVNYEQVVSHLDDFNAIGFDIVVFDEAHLIKSPPPVWLKKKGKWSKGSLRTKACHALRCGRRFILTGTPMLNDVRDLWSPLHMIEPHQFPNYYRFSNRYAVFGGFKNKAVVGIKNEPELIEKLAAVQLRRKKSEVLDLPEKQHIIVKVGMHPLQEQLYRQIKEDRILTRGDGTEDEIENSLERFLRMKQVCATTATVGHDDVSMKLDKVVEDLLVLAENDYKVVMFTQFRPVQDCIAARVAKAKGPDVWVMNGDVPPKDRVPMVKDWAASSGPGVMFPMLQVAGVALNMTAARHAMFVDKLFVPKLNEQAEDRLHRIGADATQPVQIWEYLVTGSVELRVEQILRKKRKWFDSLVETSAWKRALVEALEEAEAEDG